MFSIFGKNSSLKSAAFVGLTLSLGLSLNSAMCFAADTKTDVQSLPEQSGNWKTFEATYSVPVPQDLQPFATYSLPEYSVKNENGKIDFVYDLPVELTGTVNTIELTGERGADGNINLVGPHGETQVCSNTLCNIKYKNINVDLEKVRQVLTAKGITGQELDGRLAVSARFSGDPAGIIIPTRGPDGKPPEYAF